MILLDALSGPDFADFEGTLPAPLQEPSDWEVQSMKLACGDEGDTWGCKGGSDARVRQVGGEGSSIIIGKSLRVVLSRASPRRSLSKPV